jgi:hypothetical protein
MDWVTLAGWIGPIVGGGIGLLGGVIGTYFTVKNTKGPRERAFAIKASVLCWVFVGLFIAGMLLIPPWYNLLLVIPYGVVLVFGIRKFNETQFRIRKEESGSAAESGAAPDRGSK